MNNDSKKILAVILGSVLGFGAVATVSRNLRNDDPKDETPTIEQEQESAIEFLNGYILKTDLAEKDIVGYVELTESVKVTSRTPIGTEIYQNLCLYFNDVCSPCFSGTAYYRAEGDSPVEPNSHNVLNMYVAEERTSSSSGLVATYYVPIQQEFLDTIISYNEHDLANALSWTEEGDYEKTTACLDGMKLGSKAFFVEDYDNIPEYYIDTPDSFNGPMGNFTVYRKV